MAGQTIVNVGNTRTKWQDVNQSVGMLQRAISDMDNKSRKDNALQGQAIKELGVLADEKETSRILQDTRKGTLNDQFEKRFNDEQSALYENTVTPDGTPTIKRRVLEDTAQQELLSKRQDEWEAGKFGVDPLASQSAQQGNLDVLNKFGGRIEDPGAYADSVYNQMLQAGVSPEKAKVQRDQIIADNKAPEMSKVALQDRKFTQDAALSMRNKNADLLKDKYTTSRSISDSTKTAAGRYAGTRYSGLSGSGGETIKNYAYGDQFTGPANGFLPSFGDNPSEVQGTLNKVKTNISIDPKYSKLIKDRDITMVAEALKDGKSNKWFSWDASMTAGENIEAGVKQVMDARIAAGTTGTGTGKGTSQYDSFSRKGMTPTDRAAFDKGMSLIDDEYERAINSLAGSTPSNKTILDAVFGPGAKVSKTAKKEVITQVKKDIKTGNTKANKKILKGASDVVENQILKSEGFTGFGSEADAVAAQAFQDGENDSQAFYDDEVVRNYTPNMKVDDFDGTTTEFYDAKFKFDSNKPSTGNLQVAKDSLSNSRFAKTFLGYNNEDLVPQPKILEDGNVVPNSIENFQNWNLDGSVDSKEGMAKAIKQLSAIYPGKTEKELREMLSLGLGGSQAILK